MRPVALLAALALLASPVFAAPAASAAEPADKPIVLVIHGGAGTILPENMTPEREAEYRAELTAGLETGFAILAAGGSSLDAVEATLRRFEDSPLFNAGKGAVFTAEGKNELDASIMDGATRAAGAVAGVTTVRHPISAARAVMEKSEHVMLAGRGAEVFAESVGLEIVEPGFFFTERRWDALQKALRGEGAGEEAPPAPHGPAATDEPPAAIDSEAGEPPLPADPETVPPPPPTDPHSAQPPPPVGAASAAAGSDALPHFGTVGAVALDRQGRLAAGTSTGGMTAKRFGRVGDSPIVGAGTYASERCAVSATGHGEYFIRFAVAHDVCARAAYAGVPLAEAAETVIHRVLKPAGGTGGVIALDADGNLAMPFNTKGMYRGYVRADGVPYVAIYE